MTLAYLCLQIHKTGSTTFHNILCRFALHRNLKVALFTSQYGKPFPDTCRPELLFEHLPIAESDVIANSSFTPYNIACDHARYDERYPFSYMPRDTVSVTLIREPFSRLTSAFRYFGLAKQLDLAGEQYPLYQFLLRVNSSKTAAKIPVWTRNTQMYTFGWPDIHNNSDAAVRRYVSLIESRFDLVLTVERLHESLVLLRRRYGWSMRDILHSMNNVHRRVTPSLPSDDAGLARARAIDRRFSRADYIMYEHFARKLNQSIAKQPSDFHQEVAYFRQLNDNVTSQCATALRHFHRHARFSPDSRQQQLRRLYKPVFIAAAGRWHTSFNLTLLDCRLMTIDTLFYQNALRVRQFPATCGRTGGPPVRQPVYKNHVIGENWCRNDTRDIYNFSLDALLGRERLL